MKYIIVIFLVLLSPGTLVEAIFKQYYLRTDTKLDWYDAFDACKAENKRLATINSALEEASLEFQMIAAGKDCEWMWTSGTDQEQEDCFEWASTNEPFTYTKWSDDQPDDYGNNEDCVHVWPVPNNQIHWNDYECSQLLYYICEDIC